MLNSTPRQPDWHRALSFERLDARIVLTSAGLCSVDVAPTQMMAAAEGEDGGQTPSVSRDGVRVVVTGTADNDEVVLQLGEDEHVLTVGGIDHTYSAAEVNEFSLAGYQGIDRVEVASAKVNDQALVEVTEAELTSDAYTVTIESFEEIQLDGGAGDNRVVLRDSEGDDTFVGGPDFSTLSNASFYNFVSNFSTVEAFASLGDDVANLLDSRGDDHFLAERGFSEMEGPGFLNRADGFDRTHAESTAGNDTAEFHNLTSDDLLYGRQLTLDVEGPQRDQNTHGFAEATVFTQEDNRMDVNILDITNPLKLDGDFAFSSDLNKTEFVTPSSGLLAGDINGDGAVNFSDFVVLVGNFGRDGVARGGGDLDRDGQVNFGDFVVLVSNFGRKRPPLIPMQEEIVADRSAIMLVRGANHDYETLTQAHPLVACGHGIL